LGRAGAAWAAALGLLLAAAMGGCGMRSGVEGFSAYPGFDAYFAAHPPAETPPGAADRALLARYRPRLVLPPGHAGTIDFYRDYLPQTRMVDLADGRLLADPPTPAELAARRLERTVALDLVADPPETHPAAYGKVTRERVLFATDTGSAALDLTFLTYNVPFAHSGLPAALGRTERLLVGLAHAVLGWDRDDWHELDVYTACTVVLGPDGAPFAVLLAQHNHHRAYLVGRDLAWPVDDRVRLDVAVSSNELYLASDAPGPVRHRTIPFPDDLDYLLSGRHAPLFNGFDVTYGSGAGGTETDYALEFLAPADPFYTFRGRLGEYRPFLGYYVGRSGSPGADYYTLPDLLPLGRTLQFAYLQDGDPDDIAAVRRHVHGRHMDIDALVDHGGRTLWRDWRALQAPAPGASRSVLPGAWGGGTGVFSGPSPAADTPTPSTQP